MSEYTMGDAIELFQAIEDVLKLFEMHDERFQAPETVRKALDTLAKRCSPEGYVNDERTAAFEIGDIHRKLVRRYTYAKIMRSAPIGIGRAGAGKGAR